MGPALGWRSEARDAQRSVWAARVERAPGVRLLLPWLLSCRPENSASSGKRSGLTVPSLLSGLASGRELRERASALSCVLLDSVGAFASSSSESALDAACAARRAKAFLCAALPRFLAAACWHCVADLFLEPTGGSLACRNLKWGCWCTQTSGTRSEPPRD